MLVKLLGLFLIFASGLTASAQAPGDFAPRNSLVYARANDVSGALNALGGDGWKERVLELLRLADAEDAPGIEEARRFIDYLGETELIIADLMVRDPHVQLIEVTRLKEGAPQTFSESFVESFDGSLGYEATPTTLRNGPMLIRIENGLYITTIGEAAEAHVRDVLAGETEESLSNVKRFQDWRKTARGDIVAWADMRAWRTMVDRLGDEVPSDIREILKFVEWQKWDAISASISLPSRTGDLRVQLSVTLNEPFEKLAALLKPSGASRLAPMLPAETMMFASAQLGTNHEQTLHDILRLVHDEEMHSMPQRMQWRVESWERQIEWARRNIERYKADESMQEEQRKQLIERETENIRRYEQAAAEAREQAASFKTRPFEPHGTPREGTETNAEEFDDELEEALVEMLGITRQEAAAALGREVVIGALGLPPAGQRFEREVFEYGWFVMVETEPGFDEVKNKVLDRMLARTLAPDDASREAEQAREMAAQIVHYQVPGGEILGPRSVRDDFVIFAGSGIAGAAPSDYVARRLLQAASGQGRIPANQMPMGTAGSKLGWLNLAALMQRLNDSSALDARRWGRMPEPFFDLQRLLPGGAIVSARSDETSASVTITASLVGLRDLQPVLTIVRDELAAEGAWRHDRVEANALVEALRAWQAENRQPLAALDAREYREFLAALTPEALIEHGHYQPRDGMRSAFDPAHAQRFAQIAGERNAAMGEPADLSESGFAWYGLRPDKWPEPREEDEGDRRKYEYMGGDNFGWIVAATREPWIRGGRLVVREREMGRFSVYWMHEQDFNALRAANSRGELVIAEGGHAQAEVPEWWARKELADHMYGLSELQERLEEKRREQGEDWRPQFRNGTQEELAVLLGPDAKYDDPSSLSIETTEEGIHVRRSHGNLWIEYGPEGEKASWQGG